MLFVILLVRVLQFIKHYCKLILKSKSYSILQLIVHVHFILFLQYDIAFTWLAVYSYGIVPIMKKQTLVYQVDMFLQNHLKVKFKGPQKVQCLAAPQTFPPFSLIFTA